MRLQPSSRNNFFLFILLLKTRLRSSRANYLMLAHEGSRKILSTSRALFLSMIATIRMGIELSKSLKISTEMTRNSLSEFLLWTRVRVHLRWRVFKYSLSLPRLTHTTYALACGLMNEKIRCPNIPATFFAECMRIILFAIHFSKNFLINKLFHEQDTATSINWKLHTRVLWA